MSEGNSVKILEWNIHGATGFNNYSIPIFVAEEVMNQDTHIVVLTEFIITAGWHHIKSVLEKKYILFTSYESGQNGILIAVKKGIEGLNINSVLVSTDMNTNQNKRPNFLQIKLNKDNGKPIFIMGIRIRDDNYTYQFDALRDHMDSLPENSKVICIGDFNEWPKEVQQNLGSKVKVFAPRFNDNNSAENPMWIHPSRWSYVPKTIKGQPEGEAVIDLIVTKNVEVNKSSNDAGLSTFF